MPDTSEEISKELRKQESLLSQIHSEMNAGFVSKKREEQLWEVQRIITQLKVSVLYCFIFLLLTNKKPSTFHCKRMTNRRIFSKKMEFF